MVAGRHAQAHMAIGEPRPFPGDGDVGQQRHGQAGAHRHAVDGRNDRLVQVNHMMDDVAGFLHGGSDDFGVADGLLDHLEIAAGRKGITGAGDDRHPHLRVLPQVGPDAAEFVVQGEPGGVEHLRAVHRQQSHAIIRLFHDKLLITAVIHGSSSEGLVLTQGRKDAKAQRIKNIIKNFLAPFAPLRLCVNPPR